MGQEVHIRGFIAGNSKSTRNNPRRKGIHIGGWMAGNKKSVRNNAQATRSTLEELWGWGWVGVVGVGVRREFKNPREIICRSGGPLQWIYGG